MSLKKSLLIITLLIISISAGITLIWQGLNLDTHFKNAQVLGNKTDPAPATSSANLNGQVNYKVVKVIDGDTFHIDLNGQEVSVRMIGIDTPETVDPRRPVGCFGKKASEETKRLLEGKEVILEKDVTDTDKYNRLLRYVYLPVTGGDLLFVNDYLVRQGFAKNYTYPPDVKFDERFRLAETDARENLRGLWNECK